MNNGDPTSLRQMVGQRAACEQLIAVVDAAKSSGRQPDHMCLLGPGGTGKTTVGALIAARLEAPYDVVSAGQVKSVSKMIKKLLKMKPGTLLLIDEFHKVGPDALETVLYIAMAEGVIDIDTGDDIRRQPLPPFTLLAATTDNDMTESMTSRFGVHVCFEYYTIGELATIITNVAQARRYDIAFAAAELLATTSHGMAREAKNRLSRAIDEAVLACTRTITVDLALASLARARLDTWGLNFRQRQVLTEVAKEYKAIGRKSIGALTGLSTVDSEIDFLIRIGLFHKLGNQGIVATDKAYEMLGKGKPIDRSNAA